MALGILTGSPFLRTRVARRMLLLFLLCAMLPLSLLAVLGYHHVSQDLEDAARLELRRESKAAGMMLLDRLSSLSALLETLATGPDAGLPLRRSLPASGAALEGPHFRAIGVVGKDQRVESLVGELPPLPPLLPGQAEHLQSGGVALVSGPGPRGPRVFLVRAIDRRPGTLLWGWIDPISVWGVDPGHSVAPGGALMCLTQDDGPPLTCNAPEVVARQRAAGDNASFRWQRAGEDYLAGQWALFLRRAYAAPSWTLSLSAPEQLVFAPLGALRRTFLLGLALAMATVFALAHIHLRRSMEPLEALEQGTRRVAEGCFDEPVRVQSRDEFAALAESFNRMAGSLGQQFRMQGALQQVHQSALAAVGPAPVLEALFRARADLLPGTGLAVALQRADDAQAWTAMEETASLRGEEPVAIRPTHADLDELARHADGLILAPGDRARSYFPRPGERLSQSVIVLPFLRKGGCAGALMLECGAEGRPAQFLAEARRGAAELAVAISNTQVVEQLEALNWGALTALARTIDAVSPWTAGHSERVTLGAMEIGEVMGLSDAEIELLHRGGLLHDIGKIGVSTAILDKPGPLTVEEFAVVKTHPTIGARILAPIAAYREVLTLVRHHHELLDGSGYPDGLRGEEIPRLVRILTVADVFDALVSERPYRPAWSVERAIAFLRRGAELKFDGEAIEALASRTAKGWRPVSSAGANAYVAPLPGRVGGAIVVPTAV